MPAIGDLHHVPDPRATYEDPRTQGVELFAPPLHIDEGPLAGCSFVYCKDPNGVTVELFQSTDGHP